MYTLRTIQFQVSRALGRQCGTTAAIREARVGLHLSRHHLKRESVLTVSENASRVVYTDTVVPGVRAKTQHASLMTLRWRVRNLRPRNSLGFPPSYLPRLRASAAFRHVLGRTDANSALEEAQHSLPVARTAGIFASAARRLATRDLFPCRAQSAVRARGVSIWPAAISCCAGPRLRAHRTSISLACIHADWFGPCPKGQPTVPSIRCTATSTGSLRHA